MTTMFPIYTLTKFIILQEGFWHMSNTSQPFLYVGYSNGVCTSLKDFSTREVLDMQHVLLR